MNTNPNSYVENALINLKNQRFLSSNRPQKMVHNENDFLEYHLNENIQQVTLQVTQQCNFKCSYCYYATGGFENHRQHSPKRMSLEMAIKIIDFYANHSKNQKRAIIGFYGGEPMIEFDLIKAIVNYSEKIFEGKELSFSMTTNGSLFNTENIDFLSKHNFNLVVSIDGTPEIHNKSRKFANNGEGTYHVIEKNLFKIKNDTPDFFDRLTLNVVIDPSNGYNELEEMFNNNVLFKGKNIRLLSLDEYDIIEKVTTSDEYSIEYGIQKFKVYLSLLGRYPNDKVSATIKFNVVENIRQQISNMEKRTGLYKEMSHGGPCIPGQKKFFVTIEGNFLPCEKVNETSDAMCIGNIYDGFDYEKARKLLNVVQLTEDDCRNCWAIRYCLLCARFCDNNGKLSAELKKSNCKSIKYTVENNLRDFLMYQELKNNIL